VPRGILVSSVTAAAQLHRLACRSNDNIIAVNGSSENLHMNALQD
jgi:hypothetical protein